MPFRDIFIIPIWYNIVKDIFKKRSKNALKGTQGKKKDISAQARDGSRHEPEQHIALRERNKTGGLRHSHKARGLFRSFDRLPARADGQPENEQINKRLCSAIQPFSAESHEHSLLLFYFVKSDIYFGEFLRIESA